MGQFGIGQPVRRSEDRRFLTGHGRYTDDVQADGQAFGLVLRSTHAHARIIAMDTRAARAVPGVLAVFTSHDVKTAGLGTIPCNYALEQIDGTPLVMPPRPLLADGIVRHVGEAVAFVVAESTDAAKSAAELVDIEYDPLPATVDTGEAQDTDAPQIWAEAPRNTCFVWEAGDEAATNKAFAEARHTVALRLVNNRLVANPLEGRAALGEWSGDRFTLYTPSQGAHSLQRQLAKSIFRLPRERLRVVTPDVGGGFGMKIFLYPEQALVLFAARALGRPVKWTAERTSDGFVADNQGRDHVSHAELALDDDCNFLGLRVNTQANLGAYLSNFAPFIPTQSYFSVLCGAYAIPAVHLQVNGVFTNTVPVDAYRGAGRPEAIYLIERLVDAASRRCRFDPAEIRRRNFIPAQAMPFTTATRQTYDSGEFRRNLDRALKRADRKGFDERRQEARLRGKRRGLGLAYYVEACAGGPGELTQIRIGKDGGVEVLIGTQSNGQGHETAYAQIVADRLGVDISRVRVLQGDTDALPRGGGTGGSRSLPVGGAACERAVEKIIETGKNVAAELFEAAVSDVGFADGTFEVMGTDRRIDLAAVATAAADSAGTPSGTRSGLSGDGDYAPAASTYPNGCHVCEVEVDEATGHVAIVRYTVVDDVGTVINPLLLAGQVHGGIAQGAGQALLEQCTYDAESGQLLAGSLLDYAMPRATHLPFIDFSFTDDVPCRTNPLGVKGAGEAGAIGAPPAVINAVVDALSDLGVEHIDMPATPEKIWRAMQRR